MSFPNTKGDTVKVNVYLDGSNNARLGEETGPLMISNTHVDTDDFGDVKLWFVLSGGEVHVLQFDEFDEGDTNKFTFDDLTAQKTLTSGALTATQDGTLQALTLGSLGNINLGWNSTSDELHFNPTGYVAESENGLEVVPSEAGANVSLALTSPLEDSDEAQGGADDDFVVDFTYDATDKELDVNAPSSSLGFYADAENKEYSDTDVKMYVSWKGAVF
jgi:hypothetical protein